MNRRSIAKLMLISMIITILGLAIFHWVNPEQKSEDQNGFQQWFWHNRGFDLLTQVGLVFGGTLAIAAILPPEDKDV